MSHWLTLAGGKVPRVIAALSENVIFFVKNAICNSDMFCFHALACELLVLADKK